ncbi:MAG: hypothetical protein IPN88_15950 [Bacteroidetes bacterium]|nr:hypothetical protein [Bacteroidota bacterium]
MAGSVHGADKGRTFDGRFGEIGANLKVKDITAKLPYCEIIGSALGILAFMATTSERSKLFSPLMWPNYGR